LTNTYDISTWKYVKLNPASLSADQLKRTKDRVGEVTQRARDGVQIYVQWEGLSCSKLYHYKDLMPTDEMIDLEFCKKSNEVFELQPEDVEIVRGHLKEMILLKETRLPYKRKVALRTAIEKIKYFLALHQDK
jgi:hypothetical protein